MKNKFILTQENLLEVCNNVLTKFPQVSIKLEKSPNKNSNSFYIRFNFKGASTSLRVSDHYTKLTSIGGGVRNIVVDKHTTSGMIKGKIYEAINSVTRKAKNNHLDELFSRIKELSQRENL